MNFGEAAPLLDAMGYDVVPIKPGTKAPRPMEWSKGGFAVHSDKYCDDYTGILTRDTPAVDIDVSDAELVRQIELLVLDVVGCYELRPPARIGMAPRRLLMFRTEEPFDKLSTGEFELSTDPVIDGKPKRSKVEILANGQQFVAIAIHPNTLKPYAWNGGGDPLTISHASLPVLDWADAVQIVKQADELLAKHGARVNRSRITQHAGERKSNDQLKADDPALLRQALEAIPNDNEHFDDWIAMLYATKAALGEPGLADFMRWSAKSAKHDEDTAAKEWRKAKPARRGAGSIYWMAEQNGWKMPETAITFGSKNLGPSISGLVLNVSELYAKASSVRWAVKGVIAEQSLGFIYGASGTFKSFVALDYALHRCYGMKWLGRRTKSSVAVYLAAEGGAGLMRRIEAWHRHRGMVWQDCKLLVVIVPLTLRTHARTLREAIEACGVKPGDVIVDTMSQTFTGNENSNDEVADFLRVLGSELRDALACAVTVVHHSGHSATERPRGASSIIANVDFAFGVFRDEKEMLCTLEFLKVKDGERPDPVSFDMTSIELGTDEDGDAITSLVACHLASQAALSDAVQREGIAGRGGRNQLLLSLVQSGMKERELRKLFYDQVNLSDTDAKKHAYYRARDWALKGAFIELAQGYVISLKGGK